ncbi:ABC transporter substrate-binding protein [Shimia sp. SDUM112013]|uniref:ABC transporter substrate-binding protein n=1 Tax=Shimia sp. SDUM112013 TaxID=3136160 RepID=UPI0032EC0D24
MRGIITTMAALLISGAAMANDASAPTRDTPTRVVSMNLCTDQLAMMLAGEGQLMSVSFLARDPRSSAMVDEAMFYEINYGRAEEIYLMRPDLVLAGAFSGRATVDLLRRMGVPVAVIPPVLSLEEVPERLVELGTLLGRGAEARAMAARYEQDLAALRRAIENGPRAVLYEAQGWTAGANTLTGQILLAAGLQNVAAEMGYDYGGAMPLEVLAMADPDMVISSALYDGHSRAEEILLHPVVESFRREGARAHMHHSDWVCGTPHVLRAVERLILDSQPFRQGGD